jgi:hypothetical protein
MNYDLKELSGVIFNVAKKSEKAPDMKGDCLINGKKHTISIWKRSGAKGEFFSFQIQPEWNPQTKDEQQQTVYETIKDEVSF